MTRRVEASGVAMRHGRGALGIEFAPLSQLLAQFTIVGWLDKTSSHLQRLLDRRTPPSRGACAPGPRDPFN